MNQQNHLHSNDQSNRNLLVTKRISAWLERAQIAKTQAQPEMERAALDLAEYYAQLPKANFEEPKFLVKANTLRKKIESSEQHRTMSVEHGLGNEAIDVTLEIQQLELELIKLVKVWQDSNQ